jgi:ubiquinone/menaquinone biosynthesis C-methylase UbiE
MLEKTTQVLEHNKQREVEAVSRKASSADGAGVGEWLMNLPFPGTGMSNIRVSLGEIFNFAISVSALDPAPGDLVLDLGAGSCWVSDWLNRLLVNTVSLDISGDMLGVGRQRLGPDARLTVGDFEALPLPNGVFDGAICVSALHHVPDIPRALREIHRVLKDDATVVFSEPGLGHAAHPQSQTEMEELGVLERDVIVNELLDECHRVGFQHTSVHPFIFPPLSYDYETWHSIQKASQPAAIFTVKGLWQAIVEMTRFGSSSKELAWKRLTSAIPLLSRLRGRRDRVSNHPPIISSSKERDEALLCWQSLLALRNAVEIHPLVVARKGWRVPSSLRPSILNAKIALVRAPAQVEPGESFTIQARVENTGDTKWLSQPTHLGGFVALGAKLVDANRIIVIHNYGRGLLHHDISPGASASVEITLPAPDEPGQYLVKLDMVDECIAWFEHKGSKPAFIPLTVTNT